MKTGRSPRRLSPEAFLLIVWENPGSSQEVKRIADKKPQMKAKLPGVDY